MSNQHCRFFDLVAVAMAGKLAAAAISAGRLDVLDVLDVLDIQWAHRIWGEACMFLCPSALRRAGSKVRSEAGSALACACSLDPMSSAAQHFKLSGSKQLACYGIVAWLALGHALRDASPWV